MEKEKRTPAEIAKEGIIWHLESLTKNTIGYRIENMNYLINKLIRSYGL